MPLGAGVLPAARTNVGSALALINMQAAMKFLRTRQSFRRLRRDASRRNSSGAPIGSPARYLFYVD